MRVDPDDHCHESFSFVVGQEPRGHSWFEISCLFLFRATRGEVQTASHSLESQSAGADGWHLVSYPIWTSKRYE